MTRLFNRKASIFYGKPGSTFTEIKDLRVSFNIDKHIGNEPNTCVVEIYNLSRISRAAFQDKNVTVRVEAGYDGNTQRLFTGDITHSESTHNSVDWITRVQIGDGERAYRNSRVNRSFKKGVSVEQVLKELADSMNLPLPTNFNELAELKTQFASGLTLQGTAQRELTRVLNSVLIDWSIQDGRLQILRKDAFRADSPYIISQDSGMIGSPELGAPLYKNGPPVLKVRTLLYPALTPGCRINVQSINTGSLFKDPTQHKIDAKKSPVTRDQSSNGLYKVLKINHVGDTFSTDWFSEIEATQL